METRLSLSASHRVAASVPVMVGRAYIALPATKHHAARAPHASAPLVTSHAAIRQAVASTSVAADSALLASPGTLPLAVSASAIASGGIRLNWAPLGLDPSGQIEIFRKAPDEANWTAPAIGEPNFDATSYDDVTAVSGVTYEYKVVVYTELGAAASSKWILASNAAAPVHSRGTVLVIVDATQLDTSRDAAHTTLLPALQQYQADLLAEGYGVRTITAPRIDIPRTPPADLSPAGIAAYYAPWSGAVMALKAQIRSVWQSTPSLSSVVLLGHVPVPYSGLVNPDGASHGGANGAWPADVFYTTLSTPDSVWTDTVDGGGEAANQNFIGDGKFDQDTLQQLGLGTEYENRVFSDVAVGRIDFAMLDSFNGIPTDVGVKATPAETNFLSRYLAKEHAWRTGQWSVQRKALFEEAFPFGEYYDTSRFAPNVGIGNVVGGTVSAFQSTLDGSYPAPTNYDLTQQSWLWLYAGAAGFPSRNVIHFNPNRELHVDQYANGQYAAPGSSAARYDEGSHKAVFNFIYGSYVGDFDYPHSLLRSVIAEPDGMGLAVAWGARPNWDQHHMGLGQTIGYSLVKTLNNFGEREAYGYDPNESSTRISLLGDPTLRQDNVAPASHVLTSAAAGGTGTSVSWTASPDTAVAGYYVYRAATPDGPFTLLNSSMVSGTTFTDAATAATSEAYYLVRAAKLESTPSGTYWNLALGASAAPRVTDARFNRGPGPQSIDVTFSQDVGASIIASNVSIAGSRYDFSTRAMQPTALVAGVDYHIGSYDPTTRTARIVFDLSSELSLPGTVPSGRYTLTFGAITNAFRVPVDASYSFAFGYLAGDVNGDLHVDFGDLLTVAQSYGQHPTNGALSGDFNSDGVVNFDDLLILAQHYGISL